MSRTFLAALRALLGVNKEPRNVTVDEAAIQHHEESVRLRQGLREIASTSDPLSEMMSRIVGQPVRVRRSADDRPKRSEV